MAIIILGPIGSDLSKLVIDLWISADPSSRDEVLLPGACGDPAFGVLLPEAFAETLFVPDMLLASASLDKARIARMISRCSTI